jgi:hypothetical protein
MGERRQVNSLRRQSKFGWRLAGGGGQARAGGEWETTKGRLDAVGRLSASVVYDGDVYLYRLVQIIKDVKIAIFFFYFICLSFFFLLQFD